MLETILIILLAIACYSAGFFVGKKRQVITFEPEPQRPKRIVPEGECAHTSTKKLRVTAMGDKQEYYLCSKCGEKVPASKLIEEVS